MKRMNPSTATATPPGQVSALTATWAELRTSAWRQAVVVGALCLGIALFLTVLGGRFVIQLVYSLAIGAACTLIVAATRLASAALSDRLRRARGLAPATSAADIGWRGAIPGALLAMVLGPPPGLWLGDQITGQITPSLLSLEHTSTRVTLLFSVAATAISVVVISTLERLAAARTAAEAAQRLAAETQLRLLQSQLEPHMLFNTLANLRVLIGLEPTRAQAMLDRLIAFLRATLNASRNTLHPLATEFERVDDYLALMAVRMGDRLEVTLDLPDDLRDTPVPPMLLQPLVENGIKHGLEPKVAGGRVAVQARRDGGALVLTVRDTGVGLDPDRTSAGGSGFGLSQVRERLATLYGTQGSATLAAAGDAEGGTLATLRLPLHAPAPVSTRPASSMP